MSRSLILSERACHSIGHALRAKKDIAGSCGKEDAAVQGDAWTEPIAFEEPSRKIMMCLNEALEIVIDYHGGHQLLMRLTDVHEGQGIGLSKSFQTSFQTARRLFIRLKSLCISMSVPKSRLVGGASDSSHGHAPAPLFSYEDISTIVANEIDAHYEVKRDREVLDLKVSEFYARDHLPNTKYPIVLRLMPRNLARRVSSGLSFEKAERAVIIFHAERLMHSDSGGGQYAHSFRSLSLFVS